MTTSVPLSDLLSHLEAPGWAAMRALPHLAVRRHQGGLSVHGEVKATLGTPIPSSQGDQGVWVRWGWDGSRLELGQDRQGFHPFYYFSSPDGWGVGPSIHRLIEEGASPELDDCRDRGLYQAGGLPGQRHPLSGHSRPPAGWAAGRGGRRVGGQRDRSPAIIRLVNGASPSRRRRSSTVSCSRPPWSGCRPRGRHGSRGALCASAMTGPSTCCSSSRLPKSG